MRFVAQPTGSNQCGQACVAMLCNVTLDEACRLVGCTGKTCTRDLKYALWNAGIDCANRRHPVGARTRPQTAILFCRPNWKSNAGHWLVWYDGKYWDPATGVFNQLPSWIAEGGRIISYLRIYNYVDPDNPE